MQRLNRAGRQAAIRAAIMRLEKEKVYQTFTRGEICRKMGIKSTSKIRDILRQMVDAGWLISRTIPISGYAHEIEVFGLARYQQTPLPEDHVITINGVSMFMSSGEVVKNVAV